MTCRTFSLSVVVVLAVAVAAVPALAAPSFYGYTGLIRVPTAEALDTDEYNAAAFALEVEEGTDSNIYAANLGLARGLEVGIARLRPDEGDSETLVNAKYRFARETGANPAVAAGVIDATDEIETTAYVVMSKSLPKRYETHYGEITSPMIHLGIGGGQLDGLFGAISVVFADRLTIMVEQDTEQVNFGARLALSDEWRVYFAGFDGFDDVGLGVSFNKSY